MLSRSDLGEIIFNLERRVIYLEEGRVAPIHSFDNLIVNDSLVLNFDTVSNAILTTNIDGITHKKSLADLVSGTTDQIIIVDDGDGTITVSLPQSINTTSSPTFSGLNLLGDLTIIGQVDGVNIAPFYNSYNSHINNSTTAHFGQDLKITASPQFYDLNITNNINVVGTVDGVDISQLNTNFNIHKNNATIHFTEGAIDHTNIQNIGLNTHAQIDAHITNSTIAHFGQDLKNTAHPTFAYITLSNDPSAQSDATNKEYVDGLIQGIVYGEPVLEIYDPTGGLPVLPTTGDRYIAYATANGWTLNNIYQWSGAMWEATVPTTNLAVYVVGGTYNPASSVVYNGSEWVKFGSTMNHQSLIGAGVNTHADIDNHINDVSIHFTEGAIDHTNIQNIGTNTHAQIDSHIANSTTAHFGQDLKSTASPTFSQITISSAPTTASQVATKNYVDTSIENVDWQKSVLAFYDPSSGTPVSPSTGDRYISLASANGWVINRIYEWTGTVWEETIPNIGYVVYVEGGIIYATYSVFFSGSAWEAFGVTIDHTNLKNIGTKSHTQIDSHINDSTIHFTEASIVHQNISGHGTYTHASIDSHINNSTNAHFGQNLTLTGTPEFASVKVTANPIMTYQLANKAYVDSIAQGLNWLEPVNAYYDPTGGLPPTPTLNDRYISQVTASGWTINNIYTWNGSSWTSHTSTNKDATYVLGGAMNPNWNVTYNGSSWIRMSSTTDHLTLLNIGTNTHAEIDNHINDSTIHFTEGSIDHTNIQNIGTNTHAEIDAHIANTTTAHFGQDLKSTASPTFANLTLSSNSPSTDSSAVRRDYVTSKFEDLDWQKDVISLYDPSSGLPLSPTAGDRYVSTATANSWYINRIYEYINSAWQDTVPRDGYCVWDNDTNSFYYFATTWQKLGTSIDHTDLINRGTYTHAIIDSHIDNTTTAHFGQDLRSSATPTFAQVQLGTPTTSTNATTKLYVDNLIQSVDWQKSVLAFYDPTTELPPLPTVGDRYISSATAHTWIKDMIYEYTDSGWAETLVNIGYCTWVEGGTLYPTELVIYRSALAGWVLVSSTMDHTTMQNIGTNSHADIDNHIANSTTAHFNQDLTTEGTPTFTTLSIQSTTDTTSNTTGALTVAGGVGITKNLSVKGSTTTANVRFKNSSYYLNLQPSASLATDYTLTLPTTLPSGPMSALVSDASGNFTWNNQLFTSNNVKIVSKHPMQGEFATIEDAITACTTPSDTNRYLVAIHAGKYLENELFVPAYVFITGMTEESVKVGTIGNTNLFNMLGYSALYNLVIDGVYGIGVSCVNSGIYVEISKVLVEYCDISFYIKADTDYCEVYMDNVDSSSATTCELLIDTSPEGAFVSFLNVSFQTGTGYSPNSIVLNSGADIIASGLIFYSDANYGNALTVYGGAQCLINGIIAFGYENVINVPTDTTEAVIQISSGNLHDNTHDLNIVNTNATGYYFGVTERANDVIPVTSTFYIYGVVPTYIRVANQGGDYTSIKTAIESITDASVTRQYIIQVYPGTYIEDPFTTKDYVHITGIGTADATIITPSTTGVHFITHGSDSTISHITLSGSLGSIDYALVYCPGDGECNAMLEECSFANTDTCVIQDTAIGESCLMLKHCDIYSSDIKYGYRGSSTLSRAVNCVISDSIFRLLGTNLVSLVSVSGATTNLTFSNMIVYNLATAGNFMQIDDGAIVNVSNVSITGFDKGIYVPNSGATPTLHIDMNISGTGTYDAQIVNPTTAGTFTGSMTLTKIICAAANVSFMISQTTGIALTGNIYLGDTFSEITNVAPGLKYSTNLGLVSGGTHTSSVLDVTVTAGTGYVITGTPPFDVLKYISWAEQTVTVSANSYEYVYVNSLGVLQHNVSKPNTQTNIIITAVYSGDSSIIYTQDVDFNNNYTATVTETTLRDALGPIVSSGLIVTENATPLHLDISSGTYYYGNNKLVDSSATDMTFYSFYRDTPSGWVRGTANAVEDKYDDGSGTLQTMTNLTWIKHGYYVNIDSAGTATYLLVYGQEEFVSLAAATAGNMPTPPTIFEATVVSVAGIVVAKSILGAVSIATIVDVRPTIAFRSGGTTSTTDHNSLSNLTIGDAHTQYFRTDGTRVMAGDINAGGNDITNLALIYDSESNSIDVFAHETRHLPNGDDPLATAAPVTISTANVEGNANSFARSNHVHAHGNLGGGTLHDAVTTSVNGFMISTDKLKLDSATATSTTSTLVLRDANGDFITHAITLDSTTQSEDLTTGSLIVHGGVGITKDMNLGGSLNLTGNLNAGASNGSLLSLVLNDTTSSTDIYTGTLRVAGGISTQENLNVGGTLSAKASTITTLTSTTTTDATSISTGAVLLSGGCGITKNLYVGGNANITGTLTTSSASHATEQITSTVDSTDSLTGALTVAGGVGIAKNVNIGGNIAILGTTTSNILSVIGTDDSTSSTTGVILVSGGVGITKNINIGGNLSAIDGTLATIQITSTTESTTTSTGVVLVSGGTGIAKNLYVGGNTNLTTVNVTTTTDSTSISTGVMLVSGGAGITKNVYVGGSLNTGATNLTTLIATDTTDSTSISTGAVQIAGGLGITKNLYAGALITGATTLTTLISTDTTDATSISTGSVQIAGGLGVEKSIYTNGFTNIGITTLTDTTESTSTSTGAVLIFGGVGIAQTISINGLTNIGATTLTTLTTTDTTDSTSTSTGAIQVAGGISVSKNAFIGGNMTIDGTTTVNTGIFNTVSITATDDATSTSTGVVQIAGGIGIGKNIYIGEIANVNTLQFTTASSTNTTDSTSTSTGVVVVEGGVGIYKNLNVGGTSTLNDLVITTTTDSTSISTGSVLVSGGIGITKNLYTNGSVVLTGTTDATDTSTGILTIAGGLGVAKAIYTDTMHIMNTTDATSTSTGSMLVSGGVSILKQLHCGDRITSVGVSSTDVKFVNSNYAVTMQPSGSLATDYSLTLPTTLPSGTTSALVSDASGNLSWNNQLFTAYNVKVVSKNPRVGEYSTIVSAIAACTSPAVDNKYLIFITAGNYSEALITVPSFVYITGCVVESVVVTTDGDHDLFHMSPASALYQMTIENVPEIAIKCINAGPTDADYIEISKVFVKYGKISLYLQADTTANLVFAENVDLYNPSDTAIMMDTSTYANALNVFNMTLAIYDTYSTPAVVCKDNAKLLIGNITFFGNTPTPYGTAFEIYGGAIVSIEAITLYGFVTGIYTPTDTTANTIIVSAGNLYDNATDIKIENVNTTGYYFGVTNRMADVIPDASSFYIYNTYPTVIAVSNKGGDFTSIKSAVDAITDATADKQYIVRVYPGTYNEDPFSTKDYVNIQGVGSQKGIIVKPTITNTHFITHNSESMIFNLTLSGTLDSNSYGLIHCSGSAIPKYPIINTCDFDSNAVIIIQDASVGNSILSIKNSSVTSTANITYSTRVSATLPATAICYVDGSTGIVTGANLISLREVSGTGATLVLNNMIFTNSSTIGNYVEVSDGATLNMFNVSITGFDTGLYIPNVGAGPVLNVHGNISNTGTYDVNILNASTTGSVSGNMTLSKISTTSDIVSFDLIQSTGQVIVGNLYMGDVVANVTDVTPSLKYATNLGLVSGGGHSDTDLDVTINAGTGYISTGTVPNDVMKLITWEQQTVTVASNTLTYLYINSSGVLNQNVAKPNEYSNIIVCSVYSGASSVIYIQNVEASAIYTATATEYTMRDALGPIVSSGLIITENATPLHLDISSGTYYYGNNKFTDSSTNDVAFYTFYRDTPSGWVRGTASAVEGKYDDNSGTLQTIDQEKFVKHGFYVNIDSNGASTYMLVYGQEMFTSSADARAGNMPTPPTFFVNTVVSVAGIVVTRSLTDEYTIDAIVDTRPTIAFRSGGTTATTDHNSLSNLTDGDAHTQYFRTDGTRVMAGDINAGGNDITNLALIYDSASHSINVFAHEARHLPNGADPLAIGTPVTISTANAEGNANSFARSNHVHAHGNLGGGTLHDAVTTSVNGFMISTDKLKLDNATASPTANTLVLRDASGNFSGNIITNTSTVDSTSTSTGSVVVSGGLGVAKWTYSNGMNIVNTTVSSDTTTGALIISGGVGIAKSLYVGQCMHASCTLDSTSISTGSIVVTGGAGFSKNLYVGGNAVISESLTSATGSITNLSVTSTEESTSITTGSLLVSGGTSITKNLYVGGNSVMTGSLAVDGITSLSTTDSTSISTGSVQISGGVGIAKWLHSGGLHVLNTTNSSDTQTGSVIVDGGISIAKSVYVGQCIHAACTIDSTSISTGSLVVSGGVGFSNNLYVGGNTNISGTLTSGAGSLSSLAVAGTTNSTSSSTGSVQVAGGMGIIKNLYVGSNVVITNNLTSNTGTLIATTESTSTDTGTLIVSGGIGLAKNLYVGGTSSLTTLTVTTTTDATSTSTGIVQIAGGVGIAKNLYVGGLLNSIGLTTLTSLVVSTTTDSTSSSTGSVQIAGGIGITKNLNVGGTSTLTTLIVSSTDDATSTSTGVVQIAGGIGIAKTLYTNQELITGTTESTSISTGALIISGGLGVAKKISSNNCDVVTQLNTNTIAEYTTNAGVSINNNSKFYVLNMTESTDYSTGAEVISGGLGITKSASIGNVLRCQGTTDSTSISTGIVLISGGVGISKNLYVGGNTNIIGTGTITTLLTTSTVDATSTSTGSVLIAGGMGIAKSLYVTTEQIIATTVASSTSTGALQVAGGVGVGGTVYATTVNTGTLTMTNSVTSISIDGTFADNSDAILPTQKAVKTYGDGKYTKIWRASEQQTSGVAGGGYTSGSWITRTVNTLEGETADTSVTLLANQLTLTSGRYWISAASSYYFTGDTKLRIANITDTTYTYGTNVYSNVNSCGGLVTAEAFIDIASTKVFEIQFRGSRTQATTGLGRAASFGTNEVYTQVTVIKYVRL